ncbi:MAG: ATP-binding protein [Polyangiaceae bacterium]
MSGTNEAAETLEMLRQRMLRLRVQNAVLGIGARHHNLLHRRVFEELSEVVAKYTQVRAMGLIVRDGDAHVRVYSISKERPDFAVFGARIPQTDHIIQTIHIEGKALICDDTRAGSGADLLLAKSGFLSYVELPVRAPGEETVLAGLMFGFRELDGARKAPMQILNDVAEVIGANMRRAFEAARDRRLALILETSGDAMISWDKDDRITDANAAAEVLAGRPRRDLLGMNVRSLLVQVASPGGDPPGPQGARMHLLTPAGPRTVSATVTSLDDDPVVAAHALLRDHAEVVKAEDEAAQHLTHIRRLEEQHRAVLDNLPLLIFRLDPKTGELTYLNRHAERLLGWPTAEALCTPNFLFRAHADPDSSLDFERAVDAARAGHGAAPYEARLRRRDGEEIAVQGTVYPMLDDRGGVVAIEGVLADVSSEQAARSRLVQADRLSTLGTLAAGVAHEINNPAAFVLLGIDMLDRLLQSAAADLAEGPRTQATGLVRDLRDSVRRIVDIARDLRLFASAPSEGAQRTLIDVNRAVEGALTLTRGHIIERASIKRDLGDVPPVLMEDNRLGQVIVNLLVNAAQAIPKPGTGPIARRGPESQPMSPRVPQTITVTTRVIDEDVAIEVSDTGVGIAPENQHRIWTPFFTTKSPDVGTGLGLSISKDIVERAGGTIECESPVPGTARGTRFTIRLPMAKGPISSATPSGSSSLIPVSAPTSSARERETARKAREARVRVLIVEDEPALARALAEGIGAHHAVTVVGNGRDALDLLLPEAIREAGPVISGRTTLVSGVTLPRAEVRFDVVLCDLRMPGMSGERLYSEVKAYDSAQAAAFLFMTGVGFGADVERFLRESGRPVLEKPFATEAALAEIRKIVNGPSIRVAG